MFVPPRLNAALRCAVKWAPVLVKATAGSFKSNMLDDMVIQQHMPWWEAIYERFSLKGPADETLYIHNKLSIKIHHQYNRNDLKFDFRTKPAKI